MISITHVKAFCREDLSLIENYDKAIADTTQIWDCHHRLEIQGNIILSRVELKELGLYYHRPACELIFLTKAEHTGLHHKGLAKPKSEQHRKKLALAHTGKKLSAEHKASISKSHKGKPKSEEWKRKLSESVKRTKQLKKQQKELKDA